MGTGNIIHYLLLYMHYLYISFMSKQQGSPWVIIAVVGLFVIIMLLAFSMALINMIMCWSNPEGCLQLQIAQARSRQPASFINLDFNK